MAGGAVDLGDGRRDADLAGEQLVSGAAGRALGSHALDGAGTYQVTGPAVVVIYHTWATGTSIRDTIKKECAGSA